MRAIIVGFGRIADSIRHDHKMAARFPYASHAQILSVHPGFEWMGVVDNDPMALKQAKAWHVPHVGSGLKEVVTAVRPEFAVLAIGPQHRLDVVRSMPDLRAVMVEKPLGKGGAAFLDYCDSQGIAVTVNFWRRGVTFFQRLAAAR